MTYSWPVERYNSNKDLAVSHVRCLVLLLFSLVLFQSLCRWGLIILTVSRLDPTRTRQPPLGPMQAFLVRLFKSPSLASSTRCYRLIQKISYGYRQMEFCGIHLTVYEEQHSRRTPDEILRLGEIAETRSSPVLFGCT